jgi:hypothetical protein
MYIFSYLIVCIFIFVYEIVFKLVIYSNPKLKDKKKLGFVIKKISVFLPIRVC